MVARSVQSSGLQGMTCKNRPDIKVTLKPGQERATVTWDMPTGDTVKPFTNDLPAGEHRFWYRVDGVMCLFVIIVEKLTTPVPTQSAVMATTSNSSRKPTIMTAPITTTELPTTKRCLYIWKLRMVSCSPHVIAVFRPWEKN